MRKTIVLLSLSVMLSGALCFAAEPSKPATADRKIAGGEPNVGKPDVGQKLQTDAKQALKKVEAAADKAEHAVVTTVKDMGQKGATTLSTGNNHNKKTKGPSLDQSMKEFGKNAEKAGTAMENGVKKLGSEAKKQVEKADQAIKKKTNHK